MRQTSCTNRAIRGHTPTVQQRDTPSPTIVGEGRDGGVVTERHALCGRQPHPNPPLRRGGSHKTLLPPQLWGKVGMGVWLRKGTRFAAANPTPTLPFAGEGATRSEACTVQRHASRRSVILNSYILGSVTPCCPWYLPPRSLYEVSHTSSLSKNSTCAMPSLA